MLTNLITQLQSFSLLAQSEAESPGQLAVLGGHLLAVIVFSAIGIVVFIGGLIVIEKMTPFSINKEILDEHNSAVAIVLGAIIIGMALIIAASVLG